MAAMSPKRTRGVDGGLPVEAPHSRTHLVAILTLLGLLFIVYGARPYWTPLVVRFYVSRLDDDSYFDFDRRAGEDLPWPAYHLAVARLEGFGQQAVDALLDVVDDDNARVRERALTALARIGDRRALAPAVRALVDHDPAVRATAVWAVTCFSTDIPQASVAGSVTDFLASLERVKAPRIQPLLNAFLKDDDESVRQAAQWALERLTPSA